MLPCSDKSESDQSQRSKAVKMATSEVSAAAEQNVEAVPPPKQSTADKLSVLSLSGQRETSSAVLLPKPEPSPEPIAMMNSDGRRQDKLTSTDVSAAAEQNVEAVPPPKQSTADKLSVLSLSGQPHMHVPR
jgi:hypothetical protein